MKAALYTRVSTDEQVEKGFSLEAQKRRLMEFCIKNNYEIYKLYSDEGISGHSISKRKSLQEMLQDAKEKKFSCVVVYKTDRLSRNLLDLLTIKKELDAADVELIMSDESVDTSDDTGMAMFSIMGAFAELERKKISERLMSGKRQKIRTTGIKPKQAIPPYGYLYDDINKKYIVDERYRDDILKVYELFESGKSYNYIAQYMVDHNINFGRTKTQWHASDIPRIIRNPVYKGWTGISYYNLIQTGLRLENEPILLKATNVEPLISEEYWDKVNKSAQTRSKYFVKKYPTDIFIFAGLVYCSDCKYALSTNQSTERILVRTGEKVKYFYYECNSKFKIYSTKDKCKGFVLNSDKFEKMFIDFINNIKPSSGFSKNYGSTERKNLIKKRDSLNLQITSRSSQREVLLEKLMAGTITDDDYKLMSNKLTSDLEKMNNDLKETSSAIERINDGVSYEKNVVEYIKSLKNLAHAWNAISNISKKQILNECIKKIYVNKIGIEKIEFV